MAASSFQEALAAAVPHPGDRDRWLEVAKWARRVPGSLPDLGPVLDTCCAAALSHPDEAELGLLLLRGLGLEARDDGELPWAWASSDRAVARDGRWCDRDTGLPLAVLRRRDLAPMTLVGRVPPSGVAYVDDAPVAAVAFRSFLRETRHPATPPWTTPSSPWLAEDLDPELAATCLTHADATAYAAWAGGRLPGLGLWFEAALVHQGQAWRHVDGPPDPAPDDLGEDFAAEWPRKRRGGHDPLAVEDPAWWQRVEGQGLASSSWGALAEWTDTSMGWPRLPRFEDNWLYMEDTARWQTKIAARSSERAQVVILPTEGFEAFGPRLVGGNAGDHDPRLGFRVAVVAGAAEVPAVERVWRRPPEPEARRAPPELRDGAAGRSADGAHRTGQDAEELTTAQQLGCLLALAATFLVPYLITSWLIRP